MKIGYARVSTDDQDCTLQVQALEAAGCEKIYQEKASGGKFDRPELIRCIDALRPGDTLAVWRLDRLGRSTKDLIELVNSLKEKGIHFESLQESISTTTASGQLVFHLFAALAEFERNLIRERTKAGLASARARGRKGGRKPVLDGKDKEKFLRLADTQQVPIKELAEMFHIGRSTAFKILKENRA